ncbi:MAG: hypothetical protein LBD24_02965 [Spirochaetaceae bacterium]|jgi:hypothetical protein|nr:hypothetical protein [Spirochaetaceae bacterium]
MVFSEKRCGPPAPRLKAVVDRLRRFHKRLAKRGKAVVDRLRRFHKRPAKRSEAVVDWLQALGGTLFETAGGCPTPHINGVLRRAFVLVGLFIFASCAPEVETDPRPKKEAEAEEAVTLNGIVFQWDGTETRLTFRESTVTYNVGYPPPAYPYTFDPETRAGTIETLGAFTVSEDFLTMDFPNFNGVAPAQCKNLNAAIVGSVWRLNHGVLTFGPKNVKLHKSTYTYSFDAATKTGTVSGVTHTNGEWTKLGPFSLSDDGQSVTFSDYKESLIPVTFTKEPAGGGTSDSASLVGSDWWWDSTSLHLDFINENTALLWSISGYYAIPIIYDYTFNPSNHTGAVTNGRNRIGTKYALGTYGIQRDVLSFVQYGPYPHGADFRRQE